MTWTRYCHLWSYFSHFSSSHVCVCVCVSSVIGKILTIQSKGICAGASVVIPTRLTALFTDILLVTKFLGLAWVSPTLIMKAVPAHWPYIDHENGTQINGIYIPMSVSFTPCLSHPGYALKCPVYSCILMCSHAWFTTACAYNWLNSKDN